jgi:hypothetical protein
LWSTPASWLLNRMVTAAPAGTEISEVLNANPFAIRSLVTGPGAVVAVAVVAGVVVDAVGAVVIALVIGVVVEVGVMIVVGTVVIGALGVAVGVTGPFVVHPVMRANTAVAVSSTVMIFIEFMN